MIDWIDAMCKTWGAQVRKRAADRKDGHEEGWHATSIMGKVKEEWEGAGHRGGGRPFQPVFAGYTGEALEVHRAIFEPRPMQFDLYATLKVHYCVRAPAKSKVQQLQLLLGRSISVREYWEQIDRAHYFMAGRLTGVEVSRESVRTK